jgi:nitrite reductase/ring-hydroxylating ferredoxin subunit
LADGNISNKIIQCKFHLWEFDVDTACAVANSVLKVKAFEVKIKEGSVFIEGQ